MSHMDAVEDVESALQAAMKEGVDVEVVHVNGAARGKVKGVTSDAVVLETQRSTMSKRHTVIALGHVVSVTVEHYNVHIERAEDVERGG